MGRVAARRTRLGALGLVATAAGFGQGRLGETHLIDESDLLGTHLVGLTVKGVGVASIRRRRLLVAVPDALGGNLLGARDAFGQCRQRVPVLLGSRQQWPKVIDGLLGGGLRLPRSGQFGLGALALGPQRQLRGPVGFEGESGLGDVVGEQPGTGVPQFGLHGGGLTRNLGLSA